MQLQFACDKESKVGFQLVKSFGCDFCHAKYTIKSGPESDLNARKKRGREISEISRIIRHAAHRTVLTQQILGEFCDQAGYIRPSDFGLNSIFDHRKAVVKVVSKKQLELNCLEHNVVIRETHGTNMTLKKY